MKKITFLPIISVFASLLFIEGCTDDSGKDIPKLTLNTYDALEVNGDSANLRGEISQQQQPEIIQFGFKLSTSESNINKNDLIDYVAPSWSETWYPSVFGSVVTNLNPHTTYYVRTVAVLKTGGSWSGPDKYQNFYGNVTSFTTEDYIVHTQMGAPETSTSATVKGIVESKVAIDEAGILWSEDHPPELSDSKIVCDYNADGTFSGNITGLKPNMTYYIRAYMIKNNQLSHGNALYIKTNQ